MPSPFVRFDKKLLWKSKCAIVSLDAKFRSMSASSQNMCVSRWLVAFCARHKAVLHVFSCVSEYMCGPCELIGISADSIQGFGVGVDAND